MIMTMIIPTYRSISPYFPMILHKAPKMRQKKTLHIHRTTPQAPLDRVESVDKWSEC
jgi:hypothetical protein